MISVVFASGLLRYLFGMRLYFLRHAEAHPGADDAARELTPLGEKQCKAVGRFLKECEIEFDAAYSSPLVRAHQTANLVLGITNEVEKVKLEIVDSLLNVTSQDAFDRWLKKLNGARHVLLVGHAPSMDDRVHHLLRITTGSALSLPKAGLVCLKTDDSVSASMKFYITAKLLGVK